MIKRGRRFLREDGSITVEAAIAYPVFLLFIVFFIGLIRLASVQMTLDLAVGEATKEIATHYYIVDLSKEAIQNKADNNDSNNESTIVYYTDNGRKYHLDGCRYLWHSQHELTLKEAQDEGYQPCSVCKPPIAEKKTKPSLGDKISQFYDKLPEAFKDFFIEKVKDLADSALKLPVHDLVIALQAGGNDGLLNKDQLVINEVKIADGEEIEIDATYNMKIPSPFGVQILKLESKAVEKSWK